jgi:hypothetical protein
VFSGWSLKRTVCHKYDICVVFLLCALIDVFLIYCCLRTSFHNQESNKRTISLHESVSVFLIDSYHGRFFHIHLLCTWRSIWYIMIIWY